MKIVSLNIGKIQHIKHGEKKISTGIHKMPLTDRLNVGLLGIEGDEIADLTVHGGTEKAVYGYPMEHYAYWNLELDRDDLNYGMFGENLTVSGYLENRVFLGDIFKVGTAELQITIPRQPCFKLNLKFNDQLMVKRFLSSGRSGYYFSVVKEGVLGTGDEFKKIKSSEDTFSIADFNKLYATDQNNVHLLEKALSSKYLPERYYQRFEERLNQLNSK